MSLQPTNTQPFPPAAATNGVDVPSPPLLIRQKAFVRSYTDGLHNHIPFPNTMPQMDLITSMIANTAIEEEEA